MAILRRRSSREVSWRALSGGRFQLELWALPTLFTVVLLPVIGWLFFAFRKAPTLLEMIIGTSLITLAVIAIVQFIRAAMLLQRSGSQLEASLKPEVSWAELPKTTVHKTPSWFSKVIAAANIHAQMDGRDSGDSDIPFLPEAENLIAPARAAAEKAAILLRWFSTSAVLVGLVGTFIGLIDAVGGALRVLDASSGSLMGTDFARALGPLQFCFISSIGGVATSFALGLLRLVYEADLDAHFSELSFALGTRIHDFYPHWRSPGSRLVAGMSDLTGAAAGLRDVGERMSTLGGEMQNVVKSVEGLTLEMVKNNSETLKQAVDAFSVQLAQELPNITEGVNRGLDNGAKLILDQLRREESGVRDSLTMRAQEFVDKLARVQTALEDTGQKIASSLAERASQFVRAAAVEVEKLQGALATRIDTISQNHSAAVAAFEAAAQGARTSASESAAAARAVAEQLALEQSRRQEVASQLRALAEEMSSAFAIATGRVNEAAQGLGLASKELATSAQPVAESLREASRFADSVLRETATVRELFKSEKELLRDVAPILSSVKDAVASQTAQLGETTKRLLEAITVTAEESRAVDEALARVRAAQPRS